jgi:hypothetical protein
LLDFAGEKKHNPDRRMEEQEWVNIAVVAA